MDTSVKRFATKPTVSVMPETDVNVIVQSLLLRDSKEITAATSELELWPSTPAGGRLDSNYGKNPVGGDSATRTRVAQIGFAPNVGMHPISGADAASTINAVAAFINNFYSATFRIAAGDACNFRGEYRLKDFMSVELVPTYVAATLAYVTMVDRGLVTLPENVTLAGGADLKTTVTFHKNDGLPASGAAKGTPGNLLKLVLTVNASQYPEAQAQAVGQQIKLRAPIGAPVSS